MRGSRKFCQRESNYDNVFLVDDAKEDPNTTISGPSSARQRNAIQMAFRWPVDYGPTLIDCFTAHSYELRGQLNADLVLL